MIWYEYANAVSLLNHPKDCLPYEFLPFALPGSAVRQDTMYAVSSLLRAVGRSEPRVEKQHVH